MVDSLALGGVALIHDFVGAQLANFERLSDVLDRVNGLGDMALLAQPMARLAPAALPALLAGMLVWLWLRGLFGRSSSQDLILRLKARPANLDDFEERQLDNIVAEVAIGAGAPPPLLFLIDTPMVNAAALGSHDKGIVLFTRGMLDSLDRSETEAVAARLVSAIGAGYLQAATGIMAVFRTLGFFLTVLDLPLRWSAWRTLGGLLLVSVTRRTGGDALGRLATAWRRASRPTRFPTSKRSPAMAALVAELVRFLRCLSIWSRYLQAHPLWTALFLGPPWRRYGEPPLSDRRRQPQARAKSASLRQGREDPAADPLPGGEAFAYLFIAAPTTTRRAVTDRRTLALALTRPQQAPGASQCHGRNRAAGGPSTSRA